MHIRGEFEKQDIGEKKQDIQANKQDIDRILGAGLPKKSASNAILLFERFGFEQIFSRPDVMEILSITPSPASELLRKLQAAGVIEPLSGMGKGKYRFSPAFFRS